jgi:hypothetical protein
MSVSPWVTVEHDQGEHGVAYVVGYGIGDGVSSAAAVAAEG